MQQPRGILGRSSAATGVLTREWKVVDGSARELFADVGQQVGAEEAENNGLLEAGPTVIAGTSSNPRRPR